MISKDESIITQVVAKIASELTTSTQTDGTPEGIQSAYLSHFDFVREVVFGAHKITATTVSQETAVEQDLINTFSAQVVSAPSSSGGLEIVGAQHGPIPAWLQDACAKAGVRRVYDNRDTANAENRRPLFKAADGTTNGKGQPMAFWAPTNRR
jgi:hypothetical protein